MKHLLSLAVIILLSLLAINCGNNESIITNSPQKDITQGSLLTPTYTCSLIVYQNANYTPKGEESSTPVSVIVGGYIETFYGNGQHDGDWNGIVTNPQTWKIRKAGLTLQQDLRSHIL